MAIELVLLILCVGLIYIIKKKNDAEKRAKNANKAKSLFLARMSYEIRSPMNIILGATEIELQNEALAAGTRETFEMIRNSSNMLLGIVNNILDLSKIEAGKMEIVPADYEIASLVGDVILLNLMRDCKQIEFEVYIDENIPAQLIGDEIRIKQIFNNLLSNAFKYTTKGRIKLSVSYKDNAVVVEVKDTGCGMTKKQINHYIHSSPGLGLNITQQLLRMMNGRISVKSDVNTGSTFTVSIPQEKANSAVLGEKQAKKLMQLRIPDVAKNNAAQIECKYMPYGKVLVVDDVESNLCVTKGLMEPYGISIEVVSSGQEAINKVKTGNIYDIIFMDHMMPEMDGVEATKIIRKMGYKRPIVALTANILIGQAKTFLENGFDDFVSKPIDLRQLNSALRRFIYDKHASG
ncbi:MAG: response regulator [Fibromonadales bacterium]|nr:response regulator [Fibromonadales bacterium]